jgi:hypothetical protein
MQKEREVARSSEDHLWSESIVTSVAPQSTMHPYRKVLQLNGKADALITDGTQNTTTIELQRDVESVDRILYKS